MAKERNTKQPAAGTKEPKKRNARAGSGTPSGENATSAGGGGAAAQKPGRRKASDDREKRVRDRAYEIWESEGRPAGRESEHWEQAERET